MVDAEFRALPGVAEVYTNRHALDMTARPRSAQYTAFHREIKKLETAAAATETETETTTGECSIARQTETTTATSSACSVACQTEVGEGGASASGEAGRPAKKAKKARRPSRLRAPEGIISELEDQVEQMNAARNKIYVQKF